jgi:hypothetical protein
MINRKQIIEHRCDSIYIGNMTSFLPPGVIGRGFPNGAARLVLVLFVIFPSFSVSGGMAEEAGGLARRLGILK